MWSSSTLEVNYVEGYMMRSLCILCKSIMLDAMFKFLLSWVWAHDFCAVPRCIQFPGSWNEANGFLSHWLKGLHSPSSRKKKKEKEGFWFFQQTLPSDGHFCQLKWPGLVVLCPWGRTHPFAVDVSLLELTDLVIFPLACRYKTSHISKQFRNGGTSNTSVPFLPGGV